MTVWHEEDAHVRFRKVLSNQNLKRTAGTLQDLALGTHEVPEKSVEVLEISMFDTSRLRDITESWVFATRTCDSQA